MTHPRNRPLPLTYRAELLQQLLPRLFAGECCAVVGATGVGKSNLTHFVQQPEVQAAYGGNDRTWIVLVDAHRRLRDKHSVEYAILEQLIHRVILEAERRAAPPELVSWATDLHSRIIGQPSAHLALRYLERICSRLCEQAEIQLIVIFDQFEDLWTSLEAEFFLSLRSLRDQFKYQLVYLVLTRAPLERLRPDLDVVEAFCELFSPHTYGLGMYNDQDAAEMLERLAARARTVLDDRLREQLLALSGRHPALLRALYWTLSPLPERASDPAQLVEITPIAEECRKLWDDLSSDEQRLVRALAKGGPLRDAPPETLADLRLKGLAVGEPDALFSPVFAAYTARRGSTNATGIEVDLPSRTVLIDGQPLPEALSRLEFTLLAYLARHTDKVCPREAILGELYPNEPPVANDQRLDTLLRRLRDTLQEDARNPRYLITRRGLGVQLRHATLHE